MSLAMAYPAVVPLAALLFAAGAAFGSFFNVVGLRLPAGQSFVRPPSGCPHCGHRLGGLELVPILGWLLLKGSCRHCKAPISKLYPAGELATGIGFAALPFILHDSREWIVAYTLLSLLVILTVSDLKYRLLPNKLIYPAFICFLFLRLLVSHPLPLYEYAIGFALGSGLLAVVAGVFEFMMPGKQAMGGGDIKLMALLGLVLGAKLIVFTLFVSSLLGILTGGGLIAAGKLDRKNGFLPYGPFIAAGAMIALVVGDRVISWYLGLFLT
jgi:leader peptidase (prepilin peptidase) / N-methyltransferase